MLSDLSYHDNTPMLVSKLHKINNVFNSKINSSQELEILINLTKYKFKQDLNVDDIKSFNDIIDRIEDAKIPLFGYIFSGKTFRYI